MVSGSMHSFRFLSMLNIFQAFHSEELFLLFFGLFKGTIKALVKKYCSQGNGSYITRVCKGRKKRRLQKRFMEK